MTPPRVGLVSYSPSPTKRTVLCYRCHGRGTYSLPRKPNVLCELCSPQDTEPSIIDDPEVTELKVIEPKVQQSKVEPKLFAFQKFCEKFAYPESMALQLCSGEYPVPAGIRPISLSKEWFFLVDDENNVSPPVIAPVIPELVVEPVVEVPAVIEPEPIVIPEVSKEKVVLSKPVRMRFSMGGAEQIRKMFEQGYKPSALMSIFGIFEDELNWHCYDLLGFEREEPPKKVFKEPKLKPAASEVVVRPLEEQVEEKAVPKYPAPKTIWTKPETVAAKPVVLLEPEEEVKVKPKAQLSIATLRNRFLASCSKTGIHWKWKNMTVHNKPTFAIDGKSYPVHVASYLLFKTETFEPAKIPAGYAVIRTCGKYNCVSPKCVDAVPESIARSKKRVTPIDVHEVRRMQELGLSPKDIADAMNKEAVTPRQANRIQNGWLGGNIKEA